jgi:hypothetical protein
MQSKSLLLTAVCLFLCSLKASAQGDTARFNDYIVNIKNDTIRCNLIRFKGPDTNLLLKYRISEGQKARFMSADSISSLFLSNDSSTYVPKVLPKIKKKAFLRRLEQGELSLYEWLRAGSGSSMYVSTFLYSSKGTDTLKQIKFISSSLFKYPEIVGSREDRMSNFMNLISDNPDLLGRFKEAIKSADYSLELIQYYAKTYNEEYLENHKVAK